MRLSLAASVGPAVSGGPHDALAARRRRSLRLRRYPAEITCFGAIRSVCGVIGSVMIGSALVLLVEAYPSQRTRRELDQSREELNARNRERAGWWAAGVMARRRPLQRLAVRRPYLHFMGIPSMLLVGIGLLAADVASWG